MRIMNNDHLTHIFDLKGSTEDRIVKGETKNTMTLKDVNFIMNKRQTPGLTKLSDLD